MWRREAGEERCCCDKGDHVMDDPVTSTTTTARTSLIPAFSPTSSHRLSTEQSIASPMSEVKGNGEMCSAGSPRPTSTADSITVDAGRASANPAISNNDHVCIIKLADFNSDPRGKCFCSDNTTIDYMNGALKSTHERIAARPSHEKRPLNRCCSKEMRYMYNYSDQGRSKA